MEVGAGGMGVDGLRVEVGAGGGILVGAGGMGVDDLRVEVGPGGMGGGGGGAGLAVG